MILLLLLLCLIILLMKREVLVFSSWFFLLDILISVKRLVVISRNISMLILRFRISLMLFLLILIMSLVFRLGFSSGYKMQDVISCSLVLSMIINFWLHNRLLLICLICLDFIKLRLHFIRKKVKFMLLRRLFQINKKLLLKFKI